MGWQKHIQKCADESGVEYPEVRSNEKSIIHNGYQIEIWYSETNCGWCAFVRGIGTSTDSDKNRLIKRMKGKIEKKRDNTGKSGAVPGFKG